MDFQEALATLGFRPSDERAFGNRDTTLYEAHPNRYMTYTVHAFDDGTAMFTWEFALGDYLAGRLRRGPQPVHLSARGPARSAGRRVARERRRADRGDALDDPPRPAGVRWPAARSTDHDPGRCDGSR
jgi:hypothetical protein